MSTPTLTARRSHNGCWTCKKRRRKCDESRPVCKACTNAELACEGYGPRLRWGSGVASRGHLTGALEPSMNLPPRPKGRKRDRMKQQREREGTEENLQGQELLQSPLVGNITPTSHFTGQHDEDVAFTPSSLRDLQKETLFQEFLSSGYQLLHASMVDDSRLLPILPDLRRRSDALFSVCVACQACLSHGANESFFDYYDEALALFRADLDHPIRQYDDATLITALLLCTIGMLQGTPWSVHLRGMEKLLDARAEQSPSTNPSPYFVQAVEVMGVMDLDIFVIGRQSPSLGVWKSYRSGHIMNLENEADSIETMSGLPRSLIDLLANVDADAAEEDLWLWPGYPGTLLQCHLWEAYRFSAVLALRRRSRVPRLNSTGTSAPSATEKIAQPSIRIVVTRALSSIEAIYNGIFHPTAANSLVMNAILFPLFFVALEVLQDDEYSQWHHLVTTWFQQEVKNNPFASTELAWSLVQDTTRRHRAEGGSGEDEIARDKGVEVSLL